VTLEGHFSTVVILFDQLTRDLLAIAMFSGCLFSGNTLALISLVTLRQDRFVPRLVTVFGLINNLGTEPGT